jgi:hypothetical protein
MDSSSLSASSLLTSLNTLAWQTMTDRGGDRRWGGGEREPNKIISQEPGLCPLFKMPSKIP